MACFCSAVTVWQDKVRHVRVNGAALNKDYCRGQRDNKRELCGVTDNMIGQISGMGEADVMLQQDQQFVNGQTDL